MRHLAMTGMETASWMPFDHLGVAHPRHTARRTDIRRNALEGHDRAGARRFCNPGLLRRGDIHDNAAFEHLCEFAVEFDAIGLCWSVLPWLLPWLACALLDGTSYRGAGYGRNTQFSR